MYAEDTFFHLSTSGRVGLVAVAGVLATAWIAVTWIFTRSLSPLARVGFGICAFMAYVTLSPQVFYWYFHLLFELPDQWVIRWLGWRETMASVTSLLMFRADASISHHGQGILGWILIAVLPMLPRRRKPLPPEA